MLLGDYNIIELIVRQKQKISQEAKEVKRLQAHVNTECMGVKLPNNIALTKYSKLDVKSTPYVCNRISERTTHYDHSETFRDFRKTALCRNPLMSTLRHHYCTKA